MLIVLAPPVILMVAFMHRLILAVAPSNLLVRRVRSAHQRWRLAAVLLGLATILLMTMHVVANAVSSGASGWLNLVVLVLAWDALKIGLLAVGVILRRTICVTCHGVSRSAQVALAHPVRRSLAISALETPTASIPCLRR